MLLAEEYKCLELAKLAEVQIGDLVDPKTAFEFLPAAFRLGREQLKSDLLEYIEDYSSSLLTTTNDDILLLNPTAMKAILESDQLDLDETRVVEVACYWAEHYLARARENCINAERDNARASIIKFRPSIEDSSSNSSDIPVLGSHRENNDLCKKSVYLHEALDEVADTLSSLRLALIPPIELLRLEEEYGGKGTIPEECFINAWRILATQGPNVSTEEKKITVQPRKGTVTRVQRRKSYADPLLAARRSKSSAVRISDVNVNRAFGH
ncbi:unnamed protein product [Echinostoma caproni]|uniref:BACK domain-containing protein n=1 Tax=Echinostoma caproni TaxID=27848 RepID=A0A183AI05_9TREM|nr:unnamed protein product [Echinostoma caproni]